MSRWNSRTTVAAAPDDLLDVLTDPAACARWSPLSFEVEQMFGPRFAPEQPARVRASVAGRATRFDIHVREATPERFSLRAAGPFAIDASYAMRAVDGGTELSVGVDLGAPQGVTGRVLVRAASTMLEAGLLRHGLARLAKDAERAVRLSGGALAAA